MRSVDEDRTARAIIRDEALRLFAAHGPDAVPVRQIAAAAGVSPALVVHHFGSKDGLRETVDEHVLEVFDGLLGEMSGDAASDLYDPERTGSLVEVMMRRLPPETPVPAYLRRLLLGEGEPARRFVRRLFELSRSTLEALTAAGLAAPGEDPAARAAFLMANDLAVLLLRDHLTGVLGFDPLSPAGMERWAKETLAIYAGGLLGPAGGGAS